MNHFNLRFEKDLHLFYQAFKIPFCVFDDMSKDILRYPRILSMDCSPQTMQKCSKILKERTSSRHLPIFISSATCFLALLKLDVHTNIMFGPISAIPLTYREFFNINKNYSTLDDLVHFYRIIQQSPNIKPEQFANSISLYIKLVFQEDISAQEILENYINLHNDPVTLESGTVPSQNYITGEKAVEFENKIVFHMKNGHMNELKKIIDNMPLFSIHQPFPSSIEELKTEFFIYAVLCAKAVIEEGLDLQKVLAVFDMYIAQMSALTTQKHFLSMCIQLPIDYCQQMAEMHLHSGSHAITQCLQYIENHIQFRITLDDLAKHCNLSKRTISRHFSNYFHISAAEYILQLKLKEAAFLLISSNFSLVEISNLLAFSSQSHFSTAFKKKYNYTPQQYRERFKTD